MNLCELRPAEGSRGKNWRRGRGHATGNGKTAGRGHKGAGQRSGTSGKCGFEGGHPGESGRPPCNLQPGRQLCPIKYREDSPHAGIPGEQPASRRRFPVPGGCGGRSVPGIQCRPAGTGSWLRRPRRRCGLQIQKWTGAVVRFPGGCGSVPDR